MASRKRSISDDADMCALYKELDEASCPICMDHPHNAVLLICSSHDKGCRSYICDTSYRHSNCLDRFKKLKEENTDILSTPTQDSVEISTPNLDSATSIEFGTATGGTSSVGGSEGSGGSGTINANPDIEEQEVTLWDTNMEKSEEGSNLRCPLCRGTVLGWKVVEQARKYLNLKSRSCSRESCSFSGSYRELRRHARRIHPTVRPGDVDPSRQRAWHRLENQREYNDIVSAIHSAIPGAIVLGDYVIENGDRVERDNRVGVEGGRILSTFFLFQMIGSMEARAGARARGLPRHRRGNGTFNRRRYLWGENLLGLQDDDEDEGDDDNDEEEVNIVSDDGDNDIPANPRRRRRLTRARSHEDQP